MGGFKALGGLAGGLASGWSAGKAADAAKKRLEEDKAMRGEMAEMRKAVARTAQPAPLNTEVSDSARYGRPLNNAKGGRVAKSGSYRLHSGELIVPAKAAKRIIKRYSGR